MKGCSKEEKPQQASHLHIESGSVLTEVDTMKLAYFRALVCLRMAMKF